MTTAITRSFNTAAVQLKYVRRSASNLAFRYARRSAPIARTEAWASALQTKTRVRWRRSLADEPNIFNPAWASFKAVVVAPWRSAVHTKWR